eukprot:CAMPEP_0118687356 /NCGR_PEP_ID=MMETSP0800-20121206/8336_1 /TAXON_ID=210618 ORGANISM="Striatella unipunctata, Strain CCMP2910" /NCGR_SAMPLE_ID=MMETSP0800 /ASSEMBLY_ACC=CAM_ASM_000638 /LENGTH=173 /DNA_ID=CAMNT_0006584529 /DNA_START=81 /DNA_END=602 /DNA_ORIENTATION=+
MTVLMDDNINIHPTRNNITDALQRAVEQCQSGDVLFLHYSGHGGRLPDDNGDEDDGYDETLIPVDFERAGQIRDDDLYRLFVVPMREGVHVTCLMDCCHSGTVMDLPYRFVADGDNVRMERDGGFNFDGLLGLAGGFLAANAMMNAVGGGGGGGGDDDFGECCECIMALLGDE